MVARAVKKAGDWPSLPSTDLGLALNSFVTRISVLAGRVDMAIRPDRLAAWIMDAEHPASDAGEDATIISAPARLRQRGQEMRLVFGHAHEPPSYAALVRLLTRVHAVRRRLFEDRSTIDEVAQAEGLTPSYTTRLVRLAFLAHDIVGAILSGRYDPDLTVTRLMADTRFPLDWSEQRRVLTPAYRRLAASRRCRPIAASLHPSSGCGRPDAVAAILPAAPQSSRGLRACLESAETSVLAKRTIRDGGRKISPIQP